MKEGIPFWPAVIFVGYSILVTVWWLEEWFKRIILQHKVGHMQDELDKLRKEKQ